MIQEKNEPSDWKNLLGGVFSVKNWRQMIQLGRSYLTERWLLKARWLDGDVMWFVMFFAQLKSGVFFEGFKCWRFIIFPLDLYWEIRLSGTTEPVVVVFKCSQCKHVTFGVGWCWCLELLKVTGIDSESSLANGFLVSGMQKRVFMIGISSITCYIHG